MVTTRHKKGTWQDSSPLYDENSPTTSNTDNFLNLIKGIYEKPLLTSCLMVKDQTVSPKVRNKTGCLLSSLLFYIILGVTARTLPQEYEIKGIHLQIK